MGVQFEFAAVKDNNIKSAEKVLHHLHFFYSLYTVLMHIQGQISIFLSGAPRYLLSKLLAERERNLRSVAFIFYIIKSRF